MPGLKMHLVVLALVCASVVGACRDTAAPVQRPGGKLVQQMDCTARTLTRTVTCAEAGLARTSRRNIIIGGPNGDRIRLRSDSISVVADTFAFNVSIQNLKYQWLGTTDGITVDTAGIKIFFFDSLRVERPVDPGQPSFMRVANADGRAVFVTDTTEYYLYPQMLAHCEISNRKRWKFLFANVDSFYFSVKVSTEAVGSEPNDCDHDQGGGG